MHALLETVQRVFSLRSVPWLYISGYKAAPQGPTIVGTGNGTPEVPELPGAWGYRRATLSPGVIDRERMLARASSRFTVLN
jgi:hypothetical protein